MRPLPQGTQRRVDARSPRGTGADREPGRGCARARAARLIGAIVAGGESRRFGGQPKGLLTVGGVRIIDRVAGALRAVASELMIVANDERAATWVPDARVVGDAWPARGSLVGIHAALTRATEPVIVVAWDMPFVTSDLFELLHRHSPRSAYAAAAEGAAGPEPFCAVYTPACVPYIEARLAGGDLRVSALLGALPRVERVDVRMLGDAERLFFNVNSADDLVTAERIAAAG